MYIYIDCRNMENVSFNATTLWKEESNLLKDRVSIFTLIFKSRKAILQPLRKYRKFKVSIGVFN